MREGDVAYVATTGEGELVDFRRGHFYGMTTHARGAIFLMPSVRAMKEVERLAGRLDIVVYAAGVSHEAVVWKLTVDQCDHTHAVNLRGAFLEPLIEPISTMRPPSPRRRIGMASAGRGVLRTARAAPPPDARPGRSARGI